MNERCICGAAVENTFGEGEVKPWMDSWAHVPGSDTRCTEVRRISEFLPDRDLIQGAAEQMATLMDRARRARGEVERFQSIIGELMEEVGSLRAELSSPDLVRRATLTEVWEALVTAGGLQGARVVRDMLKAAK